MLTGFVIGDRGLGASGDTHPAWMMAHAVAGPYLVVGASAVGQIHLARGLPRDDAFVIRSVGPWLAVAMADGVGSRPLSRYGATYAVESLSATLLHPLVPLSKAVKIESSAGSLRSDLSDLAPPSTVEEVELKALTKKKGGGVAALATGLIEWTQKTPIKVGVPPSDDPSLSTFRQVASVGWWLSPSSTDRIPGKESPLSKATPQGTGSASTPVPVASVPAPRAAGSVSGEPNLVEIVRQAFEKTHLGLRGHANSLGVDLADLGCTALALLLNLETGRGAVGQVGDGGMLGLTKRGKVEELVKAPDTGDPQATYTLNRPNFQDYLALDVIERPPVDPLVALYVMTDGLSGDLLYSPHPEALENWAQAVDQNLRRSSTPAQAAAGMLNWLATYQVKGSWDDRTLVVITQRERSNGDRQSTTGQSKSAQPTGNQ